MNDIPTTTRIATISGLVAILAMAFAGCGESSADAGGPAGPLSFTESDVHVLGTSDAIASVNDLEVLPDGTVWVLNSVEPLFVGFDAVGAAPRVHGVLGEGPEEFSLPSAFVTGGIDGEAWVLDIRRHALIRASTPDCARRELALPRDQIPLGSLRGGLSMLSTVVRTARLGGQVLLPRTSVPMSDGVPGERAAAPIMNFRLAALGADLVALDPSIGSVREVINLGEVLDDPEFEPTEGAFPLWFRLWAACDDGRILVHDRARNQLRTFSSDGAEGAPRTLPPPPFTEATPRQFTLALFSLRSAEIAGRTGVRLTSEDSARLINEGIEAIRGEPHQLAAYLPRYVDLRCDDDGSAWLQPLDLELGGLAGGALWLRIAPNGDTREVRLPDRFDPYRFTQGRVWGVQRDLLDVVSIAWIELPPDS